MRRTLFLTGITGFVGGWLARELLERGHRIVALVNTRQDQCPEMRLARLFQEWFYTPEQFSAIQPRITVVGGDLAAPKLGIPDEVLRELPPFDSIIHCAGLVQFDPYLLPELRQINLEGTRNVLALADACKIRDFHHVSTAYVSGKRKGVFRESESSGRGGFHNPYEQTKHEAEKLIRAWRGHDGSQAIIYRPSIVVGDSRTGYTTHYHGFYGLPRAMEICLDRFGDLSRLRFPALPEKTVNLVPINHVVQALRAVFETGQHHGGIFHLTNPRPPTLALLARIMAETFQSKPPRFVSMSDFVLRPPSSEERFAMKMVERYAPYLRFAEAHFDRTQADGALQGQEVDSPLLTEAEIARLVASARSSQKAASVKAAG
ncbi:MAG: SDR family oxidoreductase [Verrucomicrobiae bacterium]|nr:SDR family oxidoreductase [Verrucomicrobiae bacterium]